MSSFALEILADCHDRAGFVSGLESVDRYFRETARGHLEKGISVTRVLVGAGEIPPKAVLGFFTLSNIKRGFIVNLERKIETTDFTECTD